LKVGFRKGFLFGFLIGSAAASLISQPETAEAPESDTPPSTKLSTNPAIERLRRHANEALSAAREAASEREQELKRQFDEMRRQQR
jgi:hypothetical protein